MSEIPKVGQGGLDRRQFLRATAAAGVAGGAAGRLAAAAPTVVAQGQPALLGGTPVRTRPWPGWPVTDENEERALEEVLKSGNWYRYQAGAQGFVSRFEGAWAKAIGTEHCLATANGTSALITSLAALGVGPGDEVLVPPYTFIATVNAVLLLHALPVFVDSDPDTALMDAGKIEARINPQTRVVMPVHIGGAPCQMDKILAVAGQHGLQVVEDACQAHTGEWQGRRVGSLGVAGCFSFQNSKNITSGEGGAVTTRDQSLLARAEAFHNNGRGSQQNDSGFTANGGNFRLTEFQAAVLLAQLERLDRQSRLREENATYLANRLAEIPGVRAKRTYPGTTRHGYHLFIADYDAEQFAGMSKQRLIAALQAEGIPVSGGYEPTNKMAFVEQMLQSRGFQRIYSRQRLDRYRQEIDCPANDRLCENTFWLGQNVLLAEQQDLDDIADAIERIQHHAAKVKAAE